MTPVVSPPISAIAIRVASPFDKHRRPRDDGRRDEQDLRSPAAGRCRTTVGETVRHTEAVGYAAGEGNTAHARAPVAAESGIGRASGGERGGQYGSSTGGAGLLKKKKQ